MRALAVVLLLPVAACPANHAADAQPPVMLAPAFREADLSLARAVDRAADANVVEIDLEAKVGALEYLPGKSTPAWSYDGRVPGPLIEAKAGDRLVVHFKNSLPEPTTIHWHGIRAPADMDGVAPMQTPVPPGGTFTYDFVLPDAGLYWYHPHLRTNEQLERGLYGAVVVRGADALAATERVLVLDDILLDAGAQPAPFGGDQEDMVGREGNLALVNGKAAPAVVVQAGGWERWRIVNASNARYYRLALPGHKLVQVGTDGGWLEQPLELDTLLVTPGERVDVLVHLDGAPGTTVRLTSAALVRGHGTSSSALDLLELRYAQTAPRTDPSPLPARLADIERLAPAGAVRRFVLTEEMVHGPGAMTTTFKINGEAYPDITPVEVAVGAVETWEVVNESEMDHPFHLHGFFFQPLAVAGRDLPLQWKDTINVPAESSARLAVKFAEYAGEFIFHCHILEHAELGMTGAVVVK